MGLELGAFPLGVGEGDFRGLLDGAVVLALEGGAFFGGDEEGFGLSEEGMAFAGVGGLAGLGEFIDLGDEHGDGAEPFEPGILEDEVQKFAG